MGTGQTRRRTREASALNVDTGEVASFIFEIEERAGAPRAKIKERFVVTMTAGLIELRKLHLTGRERDVLDTLVIDMAYAEPFHRKSAAAMAREIGTDRATVSVALKRLREIGVLFDLPDGRCMLSPRLFWRGGEEQRREWIMKLEHGGTQ